MSRTALDPHELVVCTGHGEIVWATVFGKMCDGTVLVASGGADGTARIWDPATGELRHTVTKHTAWVRTVAFTVLPDGSTLLATTSDDRTTRLWSVDTMTEVATIEHAASVHGAAFGTLDDGRQVLAIGCADTHAYVWDLGLPST